MLYCLQRLKLWEKNNLFYYANDNKKETLKTWLLKATPDLSLDVFLATAVKTVHIDSQISALQCAYCSGKYVDNNLANIGNCHMRTCKSCIKTWFKP